MIYLYRRNKTGICIDRVYGHDGIVELPETLEGLPVTELGAYIYRPGRPGKVQDEWEILYRGRTGSAG